jgi:hypothetical protein
VHIRNTKRRASTTSTVFRCIQEYKRRQRKGRRSKAEDMRDPWRVACLCAVERTQPPACHQLRIACFSRHNNSIFRTVSKRLDTKAIELKTSRLKNQRLHHEARLPSRLKHDLFGLRHITMALKHLLNEADISDIYQNQHHIRSGLNMMNWKCE